MFCQRLHTSLKDPTLNKFASYIESIFPTITMAPVASPFICILLLEY